jgi:hypothetical protein
MNNLTSRITAAFLVLACCASFTVTAATPPAAKDLLMSFNEYLSQTSPSLDGNITLTGAVSERGTRHEDFSVVSANSDGSQVVVSGTSTITTSSGTISTKFTGTIYFDNATFGSTHLAYIEGTESVTGGTGAYAGVAGKPGTFEATLDYVTGNVVGVFEAKVQLR